MSEYIKRVVSNADSCCDGNKIKTHFAQIIVSGKAEKPYYEILYFDTDDRTYHIGFGSYCLDYVFKWLSNEFEIVESEQEAGVAPVRHARWDDSGRYTFPGGGTAVRCTECGCALTVSEYHLNNWNYCPVCGAKMDLEG